MSCGGSHGNNANAAVISDTVKAVNERMAEIGINAAHVTNRDGDEVFNHLVRTQRFALGLGEDGKDAKLQREAEAVARAALDAALEARALANAKTKNMPEQITAYEDAGSVDAYIENLARDNDDGTGFNIKAGENAKARVNALLNHIVDDVDESGITPKQAVKSIAYELSMLNDSPDFPDHQMARHIVADFRGQWLDRQGYRAPAIRRQILSAYTSTGPGLPPRWYKETADRLTPGVLAVTETADTIVIKTEVEEEPVIVALRRAGRDDENRETWAYQIDTVDATGEFHTAKGNLATAVGEKATPEEMSRTLASFVGAHADTARYPDNALGSTFHWGPEVSVTVHEAIYRMVGTGSYEY